MGNRLLRASVCILLPVCTLSLATDRRNPEGTEHADSGEESEDNPESCVAPTSRTKVTQEVA